MSERRFEVSEQLLVDLHWMALRYADKRRTSAPSMFNGHVEELLRLGVDLAPDFGKIFARDWASSCSGLDPRFEDLEREFIERKRDD